MAGEARITVNVTITKTKWRLWLASIFFAIGNRIVGYKFDCKEPKQ